MQQSMLTTVDNPFDPFDSFDEWRAYDEALGHNTCAFLARVAVVSNELSQADYTLAIEQAIDQIVENNVTGVFRKVTKEVSDS